MKLSAVSSRTAWSCSFACTLLFLVIVRDQWQATPGQQHTCTAFSADFTSDLVAIGVQGSCDDYIIWCDVIQQQHLHHQIDFFFLIFDVDTTTCFRRINHTESLAHHVFHTANTTWTTGRNTLAREMFAAEQEADILYKYWLFSDADVASDLQCGQCKHLIGMKATVCCMDQFVQFLTGPQQFAVVTLYLFNQEEEDGNLHTQFRRHDCADAMFNAIHREAVPVLLPYLHDLDQQSWWYAQAVVYHLSIGCLNGGTVTLGGFYEMSPGAHASYPRGYEHEATSALIKQHFHKLIPWPLFTSEIFLKQPNCVDGNLVRPQAKFTDACMTYAWRSTTEFKACSTALRGRFTDFVSH